MRASSKPIKVVSPRWKNMPSLVRTALISSPPVLACTVRDRAMRGRALATSSAHSSSLSKLPRTTMRGLRRVCSTCTCRSPASRYSGESCKSASGTRRGSGKLRSSDCAARCSFSVTSMACTATSSLQPDFCMACTMLCGEQPASAWLVIHWRISEFTGCNSTVSAVVVTPTGFGRFKNWMPACTGRVGVKRLALEERVFCFLDMGKAAVG